jgi:hypothetical protein
LLPWPGASVEPIACAKDRRTGVLVHAMGLGELDLLEPGRSNDQNLWMVLGGVT